MEHLQPGSYTLQKEKKEYLWYLRHLTGALDIEVEYNDIKPKPNVLCLNGNPGKCLKNPHQVPPTNSPTSRFVININFVPADCSTMKRYKTNVVVDQRPRGLNALLALGEKLHHLALVAFPKLPPTAPPPPTSTTLTWLFLPLLSPKAKLCPSNIHPTPYSDGLFRHLRVPLYVTKAWQGRSHRFSIYLKPSMTQTVSQ